MLQKVSYILIFLIAASASFAQKDSCLQSYYPFNGNANDLSGNNLQCDCQFSIADGQLYCKL